MLEQTIRLVRLHALDPDNGVTYIATDEDTDVVTTAISVDLDTYAELGEPRELTATIRPGDQLNPQE